MIDLLVALQLAAAPPPVVTVHGGSEEAVVPVLQTSRGSAVRIDLFGRALPVAVQELPNRRFRITFLNVELEVVDQVPYARVGTRVVPLASAPFTDGGRLYVPLQVVSELLPRESEARLRFVQARRELHLLPAPGVTTARAPAAAPSGASAVAADIAGRRRRVVVDAGHGGPDNGMSGPIRARAKIHEKDITLAVSKRLAASLQRRGVDVIMTRTTDTLIALADRGRIANQAQGDLFISVHVNAANMRWNRPADARGFETYFLAEARTEDAKRLEQMENESVRFETGVNASKSDPLSLIIADMAQNEHLRESNELATIIQRHLAKVHTGPDRGVKQAGFRVLVTAFMPAVLVEIGFGTNEEEVRFLTDAVRQNQLAEAIADAAIEYLRNYERRLGAGQ